jgi:sodium/potassium-transporting ATPase subunit alpha
MTKLDAAEKQTTASAKKENKSQNAMKDAVDSTEAIRQWEDHMWPLEKLCENMKTSREKGLTTDQAAEKFKEFGENALTEKGAKPWYCVFLEEQTGFFSLLLWFGSFLCFIGYAIDNSAPDNLYLGIVLAFVVFVTGCFSYAQTSKAASLMADFKNFIPREAVCKRNGEWGKVEARLLVPGDVIKLNGGDNIPADTILYAANEMKVNNASLTGESEDLLRQADAKLANVFESPNVAFFGTMCTAGVGEGIVFRTGDASCIGRIATLTQSAESAETPLSIEIERFIKIISVVAFVLGISFFLFGLAIYDIITNLVFAIGIIVANVPEGLLATVTVSLALTAKRMAKKMVLVKNLESVETLGSTSCICSDKTGTLTQNRMSLSQMFFDLKSVDCSINWEIYKRLEKIEIEKGTDGNLKNLPKPQYEVEDQSFKNFVRTIALSTTSFFAYTPGNDEIRAGIAKTYKKNINSVPKDFAPDGPCYDEFLEIQKIMIEKENSKPYTKRSVQGDASETGLIKFVQPLLMDGPFGCYAEGGLDGVRDTFPYAKGVDDVEALIPFASDIKFNLIIRDMNKDNQSPVDAEDNAWIYLKGAPERVLGRCEKILVQGQERPFGQSEKEEAEAANDKFGGQGERVLAFARCKLDPKVFNKVTYRFDVKKWKTWREVREFSPDFAGWFPMWNFTLVGLCSLNDPPRPKVDISVQKCQTAGIKVIMVTGDQPPTAAAIAAKVNIISDPKLEFNAILKAYPELERNEAWERAKSVVIHGDELARVHAAEDALDDMEVEKGRQIMDWISKPEVVFARTTPSQKLLIVDACQRLGHVVAVTGDGVNDSPAIKKADIGVAMGSGSDVAQNAADMLLLDDNFSSIVNGVEEGRLIFDNLKKSIAYTLSSNIPEIAPFLFFITCQMPLPLSTVLILCIDLGTDMVPAISFAYENPELDIMERYPRNSKRDHLVNTKLISFAYLQIGIVQASAGFFTYFYMLNDYGMAPSTTFFLALERGILPKNSDMYNPNLDNNGNTNWKYTPQGGSQVVYNTNPQGTPGEPGYDDKARGIALDWNGFKHKQVDWRLFYVNRPASSWTSCRWDPNSTDIPAFFRISSVTGIQICYTTEALRYAQGGYLVSIVVVQWSDLLICKTRNLSISQQGMVNGNMIFGLFFETALTAFLSYIPFLNLVLGTRAVALPHFGVPSFSFFVVILSYDELRKIYVRDGMKRERGSNRVKLDGWVVRNTYY